MRIIFRLFLVYFYLYWQKIFLRYRWYSEWPNWFYIKFIRSETQYWNIRLHGNLLYITFSTHWKYRRKCIIVWVWILFHSTFNKISLILWYVMTLLTFHCSIHTNVSFVNCMKCINTYNFYIFVTFNGMFSRNTIKKCHF